MQYLMMKFKIRHWVSLLYVCAVMHPASPVCASARETMQRQSQAGCPVSVVAGGAHCDGSTDDTATLQAIIYACAAAQQPVVFDAGHTCLSQPLTLVSHSHIMFDNGAVLKAGAKWETGIPFLSATGASDVKIVGPGTLDGSGAQWWTGSNHTPNRPGLLRFNGVNNVVFEDFLALNAAMFHISFSGSGYMINNVSVHSPDYSIAPNTDGFDIGAENVTVTNVFVRNGDDSICVKAGASNVWVENSVVEQGNGLVVGTIDNGAVRNVVFKNCRASGTRYGAHIKAKDQQTGSVSNVTWDGLVVEGVSYALSIDQYSQDPLEANPIPPSQPSLFRALQAMPAAGTWNSRRSAQMPQAGRPVEGLLPNELNAPTEDPSFPDPGSTVATSAARAASIRSKPALRGPFSSVVIEDITYRNIVAKSAQYAGFFACRDKPGLQCTNIVLDHVDLGAASKGCIITSGVYGSSAHTKPKSCDMPHMSGSH